MAFSTTTLRRAVTTSAVTVAFAFGPLLTAIVKAQTVLNGAGATFPAPLYERYFADFQKRNPGLQVNYQAIGSGGGIKQMTAGTVDFGGSDAAMTDEQIAEVDRGVVLVPTAGGAVAVVYNLPGVSGLRLSREVLPDIFLGRIERWNDSRIAADNPGVNLPDLPIRLAVRADSSGTTFIFTNHLSAVNPYFSGRVGADTAPRWAGRPIQGKGNPGVAAAVSRTTGSIGYVEYAYARQNNLQSALIENQKGEFVAPSLESANAALSSVEYPDNFRVFEGDPAEGYPIAGLTWMMVYRQYPDPAKADAIKKLVQYALTDGQELNATLDYTRIPQSVTQRALETVNSSVTSGAAANP